MWVSTDQPKGFKGQFNILIKKNHLAHLETYVLIGHLWSRTKCLTDATIASVFFFCFYFIF